MAYATHPSPGPPMPPNAPVHTSANWWRDLQRFNASAGRDWPGSQGLEVRLGSGVVILPANSRARFLGQDDDDEGGDVTLASSGFAPQVPISSLEMSPQTGEVTVAPDVLEPVGGGMLDLSGGTSGYTPSTNPTLDWANQALTNAQASGNASQIAAALAQVAAATAATGSVLTTKPTTPGTSTSGEIVPGISNTVLLIGSAIVLMVLASGGKRR